jgi:Silicon transporter
MTNHDEDAASVGDISLEELHEKQVLPVADDHGNKLSYPGEEDAVEGKHLDDEVKAEAPHSVIGSGIESLKYLYSTALLVFSVAIVMSAIFTKQTVGTSDMGIHPALAFFIFWFLIVWLAMMEGGQGALVGLQPIDKALYGRTHPRALMCTALAHKGDNMERFIVGRQFLVVLVVFVTNMMATAVKHANVLGLSSVLTEIFLANGIAVILYDICLAGH